MGPAAGDSRKPVAGDTSAYKDYVGEYQWRPLDEVETVSLRDGKLWSNLGGDKDEAFPLGSETFFFKDGSREASRLSVTLRAT